MNLSHVDVPSVLLKLIEKHDSFNEEDHSAQQVAATLLLITTQLWSQFPSDSGPVTRHNAAKSQIAMRCNNAKMLNGFFTFSFYLEAAAHIRKIVATSKLVVAASSKPSEKRRGSRN